MIVMSKKHSVLLKEDKCEGCTNCVKNCPTKAIRVHQGKATIKDELCIDCAECIRTCAYHAKYTETDSLQDIKKYSYPVALVPPSFYGQFKRSIKPVEVVAGLYQIGFKEVYDVALAAEAISYKTMEFLERNDGFYISSSCPVVVRLIEKLYPELLDYLIPFKSPVELMAQRVREEFVKARKADKKKKQADADELGIFFITPCPAKLTTVTNPLGMEESFLDGAIAVDRVYQEILTKIKDIKEDEDKLKGYNPPYLGIGWGQSGGEAEILKKGRIKDILSVSGIHNVKALLEEISRDNISGIKYFELVACDQGCVGGVLNVNNPFQAKYNIQRLIQEQNKLVEQDFSLYDYNLTTRFEADEVGRLDDNLEKAMEKLNQLKKEIEILPGLDCAACGAPDCETLAEDIVNGMAKRTDCIFVLRKQVGDLADRMSQLAHALPPVMKDTVKKNNANESGRAESSRNKQGDNKEDMKGK